MKCLTTSTRGRTTNGVVVTRVALVAELTSTALGSGSSSTLTDTEEALVKTLLSITDLGTDVLTLSGGEGEDASDEKESELVHSVEFKKVIPRAEQFSHSGSERKPISMSSE